MWTKHLSMNTNFFNLISWQDYDHLLLFKLFDEFVLFAGENLFVEAPLCLQAKTF